MRSTVRSLFSLEYREKTAVEGISFWDDKGDFVGYIDPNDAGKPTIIKMLTGILHTTSGEVLIHGPVRKKTQHIVASQPRGRLRLRPASCGGISRSKISYDIFATMYRIEPKSKNRQLGILRELLGLNEVLATPVRKLSLGQWISFIGYIDSYLTIGKSV